LGKGGGEPTEVERSPHLGLVKQKQEMRKKRKTSKGGKKKKS